MDRQTAALTHGSVAVHLLGGTLRGVPRLLGIVALRWRLVLGIAPLLRVALWVALLRVVPLWIALLHHTGSPQLPGQPKAPLIRRRRDVCTNLAHYNMCYTLP